MPRSSRVSRSRALVLRAAAAIVIVVGYADLVRGGTVLAPLALVIGYLIVVPLAFLVE